MTTRRYKLADVTDMPTRTVQSLAAEAGTIAAVTKAGDRIILVRHGYGSIIQWSWMMYPNRCCEPSVYESREAAIEAWRDACLATEWRVFIEGSYLWEWFTTGKA